VAVDPPPAPLAKKRPLENGYVSRAKWRAGVFLKAKLVSRLLSTLLKHLLWHPAVPCLGVS
jgi:hypothetical protein